MKSKKSKPATRRRRHTTEFKREAVRLLENRGERTVADVAVGVVENLLHAWKRKLGSAAQQLKTRPLGQLAA